MKFEKSQDCLALVVSLFLLAGCEDKPLKPTPTSIAAEVVEESGAESSPGDSKTESDQISISPDAMRLAAETGRYEKVEEALRSGVKVDAVDRGSRFTALHLAAHEGHTDVVKLLIKNGANIETRALNDLTALHLAAYNGHTDVVLLLLENGAQIDVQDREGKTPLLHACTGPFTKSVELLIEKGANLNAREATEGFTPLMMAAGIGETEVVKVLLRNDADRAVIDEDGDTALSHARKGGHTAIVKLLE